MFTLWYLYKGYEELRVHADKLKTPSVTADATPPPPKPSIPTPTVTPPTPSPIVPAPDKQPPKPSPEKSSPIQIPEKKQEDLRPKSKEELKLAEGLPKSVISPIDDDEVIVTRPKVPEPRPTPKVEEPKTIPATTPVKEQPQWQPILKPEEPKKPAPVTIPQWDSFPKSNTPKREDFANMEKAQESLNRGDEAGSFNKGPQQEFYQRKKEYLDSSEEEEAEEEEEDEDTDQDF